MTSTNIAVIERQMVVRRQAVTPETDSEGQVSKETRSAAERDSEKKAEDSPNAESTTSNPPESGELSTQKRASEDNEPSHVEVRASSSNEATVKPDNSSENFYNQNSKRKTSENESIIETRDLKSTLRMHKGTAAFGSDDYLGGDSSTCCRSKREKSCASGNINVCNHCNVYIYNKLYEVPSEPCGAEQMNNVISDAAGNDVDRGNNYGTRNAANDQDQQYPVAEMLYMPDETSSEVERMPDYQKKKYKTSFKRPEGQYVKGAAHEGEYRTTSPNTEGYGNQDGTSTAEPPGKRESAGFRHARNVPQRLHDNLDNSLADHGPGISEKILRSGRGTSNVNKIPKSRNAKYDMKFLGLMNEQNKKLEAAGEFENAPGVEMENEVNSAGYDESLLQSKDAAYVENTNLFSPMSEFMRRTRDVSSVTSEFETPEKKLPEVRNAEYDIAFLDLMKNQQSSSHIREVRNVSISEMNGVSTEAVIDPNDRIDKIVKFLGSMKRASTLSDTSQLAYKWDQETPINRDHIISARSLSLEGDDVLDADSPDYGENDDESVERTKRFGEEAKRHVRIISDAENYNGLVANDIDMDPARGINNQRFDNIVKLLGSIKHAENLREARNATNDSGISDLESDSEYKHPETAGVVGDQRGEDVEVENTPDDVLDNANDAITVYGPGQDIALESGSTPAKQGQSSLKMIERSTDSEMDPEELLEDEPDSGDNNRDSNNGRGAVHLPDFLLAKRSKRSLKMGEDMFHDAEEDKFRVERWNARPRNNVGMRAASGGREYQDIIDSLVHKPRGNSYVSRDEARFHPGETRARLHKNRFTG